MKRGRPKYIQEPGLLGIRAAIIRQAVQDYEYAVRYLNKHSMDSGERLKKREYQKQECENFFRGWWFSFLCDLDGEQIMNWINDKAGKVI